MSQFLLLPAPPYRLDLANFNGGKLTPADEEFVLVIRQLATFTAKLLEDPDSPRTVALDVARLSPTMRHALAHTLSMAGWAAHLQGDNLLRVQEHP